MYSATHASTPNAGDVSLPYFPDSIDDLTNFQAETPMVGYPTPGPLPMSAVEPFSPAISNKSLLVDLTTATQAAEAMAVLTCFLEDAMALSDYSGIELNTGNLVLSPAILAKMNKMLAEKGGVLKTLYSTVPQTQMAALSEGLFVKDGPLPANQRNGVSWVSASLGATPVATATSPIATPVQKSMHTRSVRLPGEPPLTPEQLAPPVLDPEGTPFQVSHLPTLLVKQTVRSGQIVRYPGNIVIIGDVNPGSEVIAEGDITVWGVLQGIAHAGASGVDTAEVRALKIEAIQLRIHNTIARRPDRLFYHKPATWSGPEVARIVRGEIQIASTSLVAN
jgi:septum formation inhibitor MinC